MAWCRQAKSHYLSQCWPRSWSPYDVIRPQWVNKSGLLIMSLPRPILDYLQWQFKAETCYDYFIHFNFFFVQENANNFIIQVNLHLKIQDNFSRPSWLVSRAFISLDSSEIYVIPMLQYVDDLNQNCSISITDALRIPLSHQYISSHFPHLCWPQSQWQSCPTDLLWLCRLLVWGGYRHRELPALMPPLLGHRREPKATFWN